MAHCPPSRAVTTTVLLVKAGSATGPAVEKIVTFPRHNEEGALDRRMWENIGKYLEERAQFNESTYSKGDHRMTIGPDRSGGSVGTDQNTGNPVWGTGDQ